MQYLDGFVSAWSRLVGGLYVTDKIELSNSEKMGIDYKNDLFVADANTGSIYLLKIDWLFY